MHSLLGLYCTKNRKRVLSDSLCMEEDGFIILLFLFILILFSFFCRVLQFWLSFLCILIIN